VGDFITKVRFNPIPIYELTSVGYHSSTHDYWVRWV